MARSVRDELRRSYVAAAFPVVLRWAMAEKKELAVAVEHTLRAADQMAAAVVDAERRADARVGSAADVAQGVARLVADYADHASERPAWAPCREPVGPELRRRIVGALRRATADEWRDRFARAAASAYLCGRAAAQLPHPVNLAWLLQPDTASRLDAGHYDDRPDGGNGRAAAATEAVRLLQGGAQ